MSVTEHNPIVTARARLALKVAHMLDRELSVEDESAELGEEDATVILKLAQAFITLTNSGVSQGQRKYQT